METSSDGGTNAINATSKPRRTYLDPLKACALSGESGVNIGKSESATYSKYMNIVRQTRRTASRVSVLSDVDRSRLSNVMRRIDGERAYSTAVMDRQKRRFKKSPESLDRHRSGLLLLIDEVVTRPANLRAKQSLPLTHRQQQLHSVRGGRDEVTKPTDDPSAANSAPDSLPKNEGMDQAGCSRSATELPAVKSLSRTPYALQIRGEGTGAEPSDETGEAKGENVPIFYTGLGPEKLQQEVRMVHTKEDAKIVTD